MIKSIEALYETNTKTYSDHLRAIWRDESPADGRLEKIALRAFKSKTEEFDLALVRASDPVSALGQKMAAEIALQSGSRAVQTIVLKSFAGRWKKSKYRIGVESVMDAIEVGPENTFRVFRGIMQAAMIPSDVVSVLAAVAIAQRHGRIRMAQGQQAQVAQALGRLLAGASEVEKPILRIMAFDTAVEFEEHPVTREVFKKSVLTMFGSVAAPYIMGSLDTVEVEDLLEGMSERVLLWTIEAAIDHCRSTNMAFHETLKGWSARFHAKVRRWPAVDELIEEATAASQVLST